MTIHHDKLAYGRLAKSNEELTEQRISEMLAVLNADGHKEGKEGETEDGAATPCARAKSGKGSGQRAFEAVFQTRIFKQAR